MPGSAAPERLELARRHLERVRVAWDDPTDWGDLSLYGFYCLEAAVLAAATHLGWAIERTHRAKTDAASELYRNHGLPDVSRLLQQLNEARKSEAYGDIERPELDPEDVVVQVEAFVEAVATLLQH